MFPDLVLEKKGELLLLVGNSGSGKTTYLNILAGLLKPQSGTIYLLEQDIYALKISALDRFRAKHIGIIFQQHFFIQSLTVWDNLCLRPYLANLKTDEAKMTDYLKRLNIWDKRNQKPYSLSQGEQQRVSIIRALLNEPKIIFADEPTSSLDDYHCKEVIELLKSESEAIEAQLIISTHDHRLRDRFEQIIEIKKEGPSK